MRALARELLALVVPPLCAACREPEFSGRALCAACHRGLVPIADARCRCGAPAPVSLTSCGECRGRRLAFDSAWAPFAYEGVCRDVVAALKSRGAVPIAGLMAAEIATRAPPDLVRGTLVPVPAHSRRRRTHGFNQAAVIARALSAQTGCGVADVLARTGGAAAQAGLERRQRLANARGSVRVWQPQCLPPLAVLVDDVYTTGATLDACARALRRAGAEAVTALTFARAVRG